MRLRTIAALAAAGLATSAQADEFLLIFDWSTDQGMLFDPSDGSLVNPSFIDGTVLDMASPTQGIMVEDEIWVTDQLRDTIYRFDPEGVHLGNITGGMDNIRGLTYVDGIVFVSNAGSTGAPGEALVTFDADGTPLGRFPVGDPFDVIPFGDDLLVANIAEDNLDVYEREGPFVRTFHESDGITGIDFPEQIAIKASDGNVLAGGFSTPQGVYEYDRETGAQVGYWAANGVRGVHELGNGNIMFTNTDGAHSLDPVTGVITLISPEGDRFISLIDTSPSTSCYADCDESGGLDFFDFLCFQNAFAAGEPYADCDESGGLDFFDFLCYQNAFAAGCP